MINVLHFVINPSGDHQEFCSCHPRLLLRQFIQSQQCVLDILPSQQLLEIPLCGKVKLLRYMNGGKAYWSVPAGFLSLQSQE